MNGRCTEHTFYSFTPKITPKGGQRVGEAGSGLVRVPRPNHKIVFVALLQQIPQPHHRIQPKAQAGCSFGAFAFERLRLLATQELFGILERILDRPAVGVAAYHFGGSHRHVGGQKKIVFLFARGVAADYQKNRLVQNAVPQNNFGVNPPSAHFSAFAGELKVYGTFIGGIKETMKASTPEFWDLL